MRLGLGGELVLELSVGFKVHGVLGVEDCGGIDAGRLLPLNARLHVGKASDPGEKD